MRRSVGTLVLLLGGAVPGVLPAQTDTARAAGPSFLVARYASVHALAMYSGYAVGRTLVVVGMLHNPRSEYREVMAGVGLPMEVGAGDVTVAGAGASTNTGWYAQLYVMPTLRFGRLFLHVTAQAAEPLSAQGSRAVYVSPGNALYTLGSGFSAGIGYYGGMEDGSRPYHGLGPALQRAVPHGSVTVEWIAPLTPGDEDEVRLTLRSSF
jgi:hypothetical protein